MRIKCNPTDCHSKDTSCEAVDYQTLGISRMRNQNISTEIIGDLEPGMTPFISTHEPKVSNYMPKDKSVKQNFADDSQLGMKSFKSASLEFKRNYSQPVIRKKSLDMTVEYNRDFGTENQQLVSFYSPADFSSADEIDGNIIGDNVSLEEFEGEFSGKVKKTTKDMLPRSFKDFSINDKNKNNNNDTNVNQHEKKDEDSNTTDNESILKGKPYALATLDGTIMLVQDEIILW